MNECNVVDAIEEFVNACIAFDPDKNKDTHTDKSIEKFIKAKITVEETFKFYIGKMIKESNMPKVKINPVGGEEFVPTSKVGDSGYDLRADILNDYVLAPNCWALIPTGIKVEMEAGYEAQIRPRSGLAIKNGITVLNSPGTVDSSYRNVLGCIIINNSTEPFTVKRGDRIAQMVFMRIEKPEIEIASELSETERGLGGFGSTGVK